MKVLWFTNTPCSAVDKLRLDIKAGGWLRSLEEALNNATEIELAICFYTYEKHEPFKYKKTQFYPILRNAKSNKIKRLIKRIFPVRNSDEHEVKELLKIIDLFKPDLIHVHGTEDNFSLVQYHTKVPVVISIQGLLNPYAEKYFAGIPANIASRYEGMLPKLLALDVMHNYKVFNTNAERELRILRAAKYIIGRTDWDRRITRVLAPISQYFIGNEILRPAFYGKQWSKTEFSKPLQIITTMGEAFYKGFETIVNTAEILSNYPDLEFSWKVVGLNDNSKTVRIVNKWKRSNFKFLHIELMGSKNEHELVEILHSSDIYCQTSHIENSPNNLCEAMIIGMPCISTFVGGVGSLIKDGEEGILIQDGDPWAMAGAVLELSNNKRKAILLGTNARKIAIKRHDKDRICNELIANYQKIITSSFELR